MSSLMVNAGCVNQDRSRLLAVKLIQSALLTANRDEINGAETSSEMRRVIELFTHCTWHFRDDIKVPGRLRSIAPTRFLTLRVRVAGARSRAIQKGGSMSPRSNCSDRRASRDSN